MNYWLISDTHFNHAKLEDWGGRSGDWQQRLWDGIAAIPDGDTLIHLGDICIGNDEEIHKQLIHAVNRFNEGGPDGTVRTILVRGNHDGKSLSWYNERWDFVCDSFELLYNGHYLYFSHRPQPPMGHFTKNIHGHTHGNMHRSEEYISYYDPTYHFDMSPELMGYAPIRLDTLLKKYKTSLLPTQK